jgi:flagellar hook-associated protein 2
MAVSSTSSSNSTTSIDVAGIVDSLMKAEKAPLTALQAKITKEETVISDLGVIKGKIASFQTALDGLETTSNFSVLSASSSNPDVISTTGASGSIYGNYTISDISLAKATVLTYKTASGTNFPSASATVPLAAGKLTIQVGSGTTYTVYGGLTGQEKTSTSGSSTLATKSFSAGANHFTAGTYSNVLISGASGGGAYGTVIVDSSGNFTVAITSAGSGFKDGDALSISSTAIGGSSATSLSLGNLAVPVDGLQIDITELASAINSLGIKASAAVTKTTSSSNYIFSIRGTSTGVDNALTVSDFGSLGSAPPFSGVGTVYKDVTASVTASNSSFKVDGTSYSRSSNTIADVIDGASFTLKSADSTNSYTINVSEGADNSSTKIQSLITAYNDLIDTHKSMIANSHNSTTGKTGTFASNPTMLYFINEIKARFAKGFAYGTNGASRVSLSEMGIDLAKDGIATFNSTNFATAQTNGLQSKLASGMKMGYVSSTNYLNKYIDGLIGVTGSGGLMADTLSNETSALDDLNTKQTNLEDRLAKIQNNYITQYSALNTLLYQLSVTSNSLTSALSALTNSNNNK